VHETRPSETNRDSSHSHSLWFIWVVVASFIIYPLSVGPAATFTCGMSLPPAVSKAFDAFYTPLGCLAEHSLLVRRFFDWYLGVWGIDIAGK
jgi:hypothetical protein